MRARRVRRNDEENEVMKLVFWMYFRVEIGAWFAECHELFMSISINREFKVLIFKKKKQRERERKKNVSAFLFFCTENEEEAKTKLRNIFRNILEIIIYTGKEASLWSKLFITIFLFSVILLSGCFPVFVK